MLTGPYARYGTVVLGILLVIYAIIGLSKFTFTVARRNEKWVGGIVGLITGVISAATGVQVIPSMPFMQAIGMEKDELVQALGVFFTVATLALAFNLTAAGLLTAATALPGAIAMAGSFAGMFIGQAVRSRMQAGSVPPLVPDRDDPARALSRRQRAADESSDVIIRSVRRLSASPASRRGCRDRRTARRARG